jgi:hypothetical protein
MLELRATLLQAHVWRHREGLSYCRRRDSFASSARSGSALEMAASEAPCHSA